MERIFLADENGPSAKELGAAFFIDHQFYDPHDTMQILISLLSWGFIILRFREWRGFIRRPIGHSSIMSVKNEGGAEIMTETFVSSYRTCTIKCRTVVYFLVVQSFI